MWTDWIRGRLRTPVAVDFDGRPVAGGLGVGCVCDGRQLGAVLERISSPGPTIWLEASGLCHAAAHPATYLLRVDEPEASEALRTALRLRGFDLAVVTLASTCEPRHNADLFDALRVSPSQGLPVLALFVGPAGWTDPLARALAARASMLGGSRLPGDGLDLPVPASSDKT